MKVTELQANMIRNIAESEYTSVNGAVPSNVNDIGWVWADCIIEDSQSKGVFTSLKNAGLVEHSGGPKADACVTLTQAGFEAYQAL